MPVAGQPRNPFGQTPDRIMLESPRAVVVPGRSPGTMPASGGDRRGMVLAAGQIRHLWEQAFGFIPASPPYSWTWAAPAPGRPITGARAFHLTRALRYLTRSLYMGAGIDNTRYAELHSAVVPAVRSKPVTVNAGQQSGKPVIRNRLTSFGSRVPPLGGGQV
jgi:hypothetical protein